LTTINIGAILTAVDTGRSTETMSEIQLAHFSFGGESPERSRFHEVALRDARAATDHREIVAEPAPRRSFAMRLRLAVAGGTVATTEACNCPA
jgi:hypothetical protein